MQCKWRSCFLGLLFWVVIPAQAAVVANQLDYASTKDISDLNPHLYFGEMAAQNMIFESLVRIDQQGHILPNLATNWSVSKKGTCYRFYLRQDVNFNDGEKFNAQAVKLNFAAILANKSRHQWTGLVNEIQSIRVINDYCIELHLFHPYYPTLIDLALTRPFRFISPRAFIHHQTQYGVKSYAGTGAWMLSEYKKDQYAKFVVNPHYWGTKPRLSAVLWHVIPDRETILLALQKGEIQLIFGADGDMVDMDSYTSLASSGKFITQISKPIASRTLVVNSQRPITKDRRIRQALSYAINKKAIAQGIFNGTEKVACTLMAKNVPYMNIVVKTYPFDLKKARQLLDKAGWILPPGKSVREKQGKTLRLLFSYDTDNAAEKEIAELVQNDLKQVGIALDIIGEEKQAYHDRQKTGQFDLQYSLSWGQPYDPASYVASFRFPGHADYTAQLGLANKAHLDAIIGRILRSQDEAKRQALYAELFRQLAQEAIYIPLTYARTKIIHTPSLHGVHFNVSQYEIPFEKMYFVKQQK